MKWEQLSSQEKSRLQVERGTQRLLEKEALEARRGEADAIHKAREQYWLEQERQKYGLPRQGRPVSRQLA